MRFALLTAAVAGLAFWLASGAAAKFQVALSVSSPHPRVGIAVNVAIRTGDIGTGECQMRLIAIAPGANEQTALDALVNGGTRVSGPSGSTWHRLEPTPRLGLRVAVRRTGATTWRGTVRFPRAGRLQLVVPNWCALGYAMPSPAARVVAVRP
ncbi:MAG: hypothetical protein ACJ768_04760 [Gaiellaceae bacterium]